MISKIIYLIKNRRVINFFKTSFEKNVLVSYIVSPLKMGVTSSHNNKQELLAIIDTFLNLGYNVDVYHYLSNEKIDYSKYDLVFGFGIPLSNSFKFNKDMIRIYYGTGAHPYFQNRETLKRAESFYEKSKIWLLESCRKVDHTWPEQLQIVDGMVLLGNEHIKKTYEKYFENEIFLLNATYNSHLDSVDWSPKVNEHNKKSYLYFTSNGAIHRGLDLIIEYFCKHPGLNLYISTNLNNEKKFYKYYQKILDHKKNIKYVGFNLVNSNKYKELISKCCFTILPTCSEGQSTSLLNTIASGLIPITTKYSGLEMDDNIITIKKLDYESIQQSIEASQNLTIDEIAKRRKKLIELAKQRYSLQNYKVNLYNILYKIINNEKV